MRDAPRLIDIASRFAAALDASDYPLAAEFLAENCLYVDPAGMAHQGREAIIESYRASDEKARRNFDRVTYRSTATARKIGGVGLTFFDELHHGSARHTYRCAQIVYFDGRGMIERIEHSEFPGERGKLEEFLLAHNIRLD